MRTVRLLGLDFADMDVAAAAAYLAARDPAAPFASVITPNADHLVRLHHQPELRPIYDAAALRLLDSRVVAGIARLLGLAVPRVCPGSDLSALLVHHLAPGERVTVIGLRAAHLPALRERLQYADIAHHDPPMGFARDPAALGNAIAFAIAHPARFTFLAVGSPGQEALAHAIAGSRRAHGIGLCIGAALDFLVGAQRRAPRVMQRAGLEWLHRLAQDPQRLAARYLRDDPLVLALLARERFSSPPACPGSR